MPDTGMAKDEYEIVTGKDFGSRALTRLYCPDKSELPAAVFRCMTQYGNGQYGARNWEGKLVYTLTGQWSD
jgi:hypothetical protein